MLPEDLKDGLWQYDEIIIVLKKLLHPATSFRVRLGQGRRWVFFSRGGGGRQPPVFSVFAARRAAEIENRRSPYSLFDAEISSLL